MQLSLVSFIVAFTWLSQLGLAQDTSNATAILDELEKELPSCALQCILAEVPKSTCALTDFNCVCTNEELNNEILVCLSSGCKVVEQLQTEKVVKTLCGAPVRDVGSHTTAITWAFYAAAVFSVVCRIIARLPWLGGTFSYDDYAILLCLAALTPTAVIAQLMVDNGLGKDIWMLSPKEIDNTLYYFFIEEFLYTFLVATTKIAILLLYLRIFTTRYFKYQCYILIGIIAAFAVSCIVSTGLYCRPIDYVWKGWDGEHPATCVNINAQTYALAGINMSLDIVIFVLPIPQVLRLQMSIGKRVAVAGIFAVGLFVTACSIVRLTTILRWGKSLDPTYDYTQLAIWSLIEIMTGVICACMPGMASLVRRIFPKVFTTRQKSYPSSSGFSDNSKFNKSPTPKNILSKTTVSVSYTGRNDVKADNKSARSDELELTPPTAYKQYGNYTRYSEETGNDEGIHRQV